MDKLSKRLDDCSNWPREYGDPTSKLLGDAAEEIERLEAENERLREERKRCLANHNLATDDYVEKINQQQAEIERLRGEHQSEVEEFNAGYECAKAGGSEQDQPFDTPNDVWMCGFAWGSYPALKAENAKLREAIRRWYA